MKKTVRLTESDLTRIVKRVIKEQEEDMGHNFSIYDDIESELMEIPNDEVIDYLKGIIKHCEKLIEKLGDIEEEDDIHLQHRNMGFDDENLEEDEY